MWGVEPATNAYLVAAGINRAERDKRFRRAGRDLWIPKDAELDEREQLRLLWSVAPQGSALSHETAVRWFGLSADRREDGLPPHITVPAGANFDRKEFRVHTAGLPADDVCTFGACRVTTPERTYLDIAGARDRERLVVVGDGLLARGLATAEGLRARVDLAKGARGVTVAREILPKLDGRAQSAPESIVRYRIVCAGLPPPEPQYRIELGSYAVHADLAWPKARTALEYEGRQHAEEDQFTLDIDRYSALASLGWLVLRAGSRDLADGSARLLARLTRTLRRRGLFF